MFIRLLPEVLNKFSLHKPEMPALGCGWSTSDVLYLMLAQKRGIKISSEDNLFFLKFSKNLQKVSYPEFRISEKKKINCHLRGLILTFLAPWSNDLVAILPFLYSWLSKNGEQEMEEHVYFYTGIFVVPECMLTF